MFKAKNITWPTIIGLVVGGTGFYFAHYLDLKPTDAQLIGQRAQLLYDTKYECKLLYKSARNEDVSWIRKQLKSQMKFGNECFSSITGRQGLGKTTAVKTAIDGYRGVITIDEVPPGTSDIEIVKMVIIGINGEKNEDKEYAKRVIKSYKQISKDKETPIVIIPAQQRRINKEPAVLKTAARTLATHYGLSVLIDASENALPDDSNVREDIRELKPMSDEMMRSLPQFKELLKYLVATGNETTVLAVCGGCPATLDQLNRLFNSTTNEQEKENAVREFVEKQLRTAKKKIEALVTAHSKMEKVSEKKK